MPCILDSPFCRYDRYSSAEADNHASRAESDSQTSTSGEKEAVINS